MGDGKCAPLSAEAAAYIKFDGVDGESRDSGHKGEIDILAWSWGTSSSGARAGQVAPSQSRVLVSPRQSTSAKDAQRSRGDTTLGDVVVVRELDKATPKLQQVALNNNAAPRRGAGSFTFTKYIDKATPKLQEYCSSGLVIPYLVVSPAAGQRQPYLRYELTNVMVTSCTRGGSGGGAPTEQLSLNYEQIKWSYKENDRKGKKKGNVDYDWKVEEGAK